MVATVDVAIIGAGPYGLSVASHLHGAGIEFRIFGIPMESWIRNMPAGMLLKSDGSSTDLSDPARSFTLKSYCAKNDYRYHATDEPIPLKTFIGYGLAFQKRFVPEVEEKTLTSLEYGTNGFNLAFDDGEAVLARRVILSVGIRQFSHIPDELRQLPSNFVTHSSEHGPLDQFRGRRVAVIGGGSSALDLVAILQGIGADTTLLARRPSFEFHARPVRRVMWRRVARPNTGIGSGWKLKIFSDAPQSFHALPFGLRHHWVSSLLGPSGGWFIRDKIEGRVKALCGFTLHGLSAESGVVELRGQSSDGHHHKIVADHIVAATGYKIDLRRLGFMNPKLLDHILTEGHAPILSSQFETTVPGLHVVGPASMYSFGPLVRFVFGDSYTANRITRHLADKPVRRMVAARLSVAN